MMRRPGVIDWSLLAAFGVLGITLAAIVKLAPLAEMSTSEYGFVAALMAAVGTIFKLLMDSRERESQRMLKDLDEAKKSAQDVAKDAAVLAIKTAEFYRAKAGEPPVSFVAPVVSEAHSPSTQVQRDAAMVATMRAQMEAIKLAVGLPPREEPDHAVEPKKAGPVIPPTIERVVLEAKDELTVLEVKKPKGTP